MVELKETKKKKQLFSVIFNTNSPFRVIVNGKDVWFWDGVNKSGGAAAVEESTNASFCSPGFWSWPAEVSSLQIQLSARGPSSGTSLSPEKWQMCFTDR